MICHVYQIVLGRSEQMRWEGLCSMHGRDQKGITHFYSKDMKRKIHPEDRRIILNWHLSKWDILAGTMTIHLAHLGTMYVCMYVCM
jgi:hypothetical protein